MSKVKIESSGTQERIVVDPPFVRAQEGNFKITTLTKGYVKITKTYESTTLGITVPVSLLEAFAKEWSKVKDE